MLGEVRAPGLQEGGFAGDVGLVPSPGVPISLIMSTWFSPQKQHLEPRISAISKGLRCKGPFFAVLGGMRGAASPTARSYLRSPAGIPPEPPRSTSYRR